MSENNGLIASEYDILYCQFCSWFPKFAKYSFRSDIIPLSSEFLKYLGSDSLVLPRSMDKYFADDHMSDDDDNLNPIAVEAGSVQNFPEIEQAISKSLKELNNQCFVKLNWSSPSDASWMNGGTLRCRNIAEIYLLLKSSDRITFDINNMFDLCAAKPHFEPTLIIRQWRDIHTSMEFRVFVYNKSLYGICQRDCCTYFDFLAADCDRVCDIIERFYTAHIEANVELNSYTFDVYVDSSNKVWVIDFNPFGTPTNSLLFQWDEFNSVTIHDSVEIRIVESEDEVLPSVAASYRGPVDVHLSHEFPNFMELCKNDIEDVGSEDEEEPVQSDHS